MKTVKDKNQAAVALSDDELEAVTGGASGGYQYFLPGSDTTAEKCIDGGEHKWVVSSGGNFEYCAKCHAERYARS